MEERQRKIKIKREAWSSGYGRRLTFRRLWVRIPAPNTGRQLFTLICCKNCNFFRKKAHLKKEKERQQRKKEAMLDTEREGKRERRSEKNVAYYLTMFCRKPKL